IFLPIRPIRIMEIIGITKALSNNKASGADRICQATLKALLTRALLTSILIIHKPGKPKTDPESYRPISLLPAVSKVWESLFGHRLREIINQQHLQAFDKVWHDGWLC
ncbi:hypothetical protein KR215_003347, partial [Drosophila sulfurigaster]